MLGELESEGRNAEKLALMEELKTLPFGAVWDMMCVRDEVPASTGWIARAGSGGSIITAWPH